MSRFDEYWVPTLEEVKEDLFSYISDGFKDANGFRPRGYDWMNMSVAELEAWADEVSADVARSIKEDDAREAAAIAEFENSIAATMAAGAADRETAFRWLLDAENLDEWDRAYGAERVNWVFGVGYNYNLRTGESGGYVNSFKYFDEAA